jgi:hypothetical protein
MTFIDETEQGIDRGGTGNTFHRKGTNAGNAADAEFCQLFQLRGYSRLVEIRTITGCKGARLNTPEPLGEQGDAPRV